MISPLPERTPAGAIFCEDGACSTAPFCVIPHRHVEQISGLFVNRAVLFGQAQYPLLADYPDNADVMEFLLSVSMQK